jgi:hypothetical protein
VQKHEGRAIGTGGWGDAQGFQSDALNAYFLKGAVLHLIS